MNEILQKFKVGNALGISLPKGSGSEIFSSDAFRTTSMIGSEMLLYLPSLLISLFDHAFEVLEPLHPPLKLQNSN